MMPPETSRFLRQNPHLVHDADLRAEVQDLPEGDNFRRASNSDAARIAQAWCDMADDSLARATPRPGYDDDRGAQMLGRVIIGTLLAGVLVVVGVTWARAVEKAAFDAVQAEQMEGW